MSKHVMLFHYNVLGYLLFGEAYTEDGGLTWSWEYNNEYCTLLECKNFNIPCDPLVQAIASTYAQTA